MYGIERTARRIEEQRDIMDNIVSDDSPVSRSFFHWQANTLYVPAI